MRPWLKCLNHINESSSRIINISLNKVILIVSLNFKLELRKIFLMKLPTFKFIHNIYAYVKNVLLALSKCKKFSRRPDMNSFLQRLNIVGPYIKIYKHWKNFYFYTWIYCIITQNVILCYIDNSMKSLNCRCYLILFIKKYYN